MMFQQWPFPPPTKLVAPTRAELLLAAAKLVERRK